jgi:hypothetical protein
MDQDFLDEDPGLDGPDYVALVIEWDQIADQIEGELQRDHEQKSADTGVWAMLQRGTRMRRLMAAAGALAAFALAAWGIHRLRAA